MFYVIMFYEICEHTVANDTVLISVLFQCVQSEIPHSRNSFLQRMTNKCAKAENPRLRHNAEVRCPDCQ